MDIDVFTGGLFDTNCFFLRASGILIDAPQETAAWLSTQGYRVRTLLLTHGHIDHTWDAARIQREHGCQVACHAECVPMVEEPDFFLRFGFNWQIETLHPDRILAETSSTSVEGIDFQILDLPGHCPGSLGFLWLAEKALFGGDVLMAGGCGRTDLPGGSTALLVDSVRRKLWTLSDDVRVLPGHGPATTIGHERRTNPFVGESALRNVC
jgi:glyoxylase-like metal-dependent hydrolase (beta-lactamase superfamily II)